MPTQKKKKQKAQEVLKQEKQALVRPGHNLCLGLNILTKISRVRRISASQHSQLAGSIAGKHCSETISADDLLHSVSGCLVACVKLGGVNSLQLVVRVPDEVVDEEDCWMVGVLGVGFEGAR
jgi:hypothetical protein